MHTFRVRSSDSTQHQADDAGLRRACDRMARRGAHETQALRDHCTQELKTHKVGTHTSTYLLSIISSFLNSLFLQSHSLVVSLIQVLIHTYHCHPPPFSDEHQEQVQIATGIWGTRVVHLERSVSH